MHNELLEKLAALEHDQWVTWSLDIAETGVTIDRLVYWCDLWVPYGDLSKTDKEKHRRWARAVLDTVISELDFVFDIAETETAHRFQDQTCSMKDKEGNEPCPICDFRQRVKARLLQESGLLTPA